MMLTTNEKILEDCLNSEWKIFLHDRRDSEAMLIFLEGMLALRYAMNNQFGDELIEDLEWLYRLAEEYHF